MAKCTISIRIAWWFRPLLRAMIVFNRLTGWEPLDPLGLSRAIARRALTFG